MMECGPQDVSSEAFLGELENEGGQLLDAVLELLETALDRL